MIEVTVNYRIHNGTDKFLIVADHHEVFAYYDTREEAEEGLENALFEMDGEFEILEPGKTLNASIPQILDMIHFPNPGE